MRSLIGIIGTLIAFCLVSCATEDLSEEIAAADRATIEAYVAENGLLGSYTLGGSFYTILSVDDSVQAAIDSLNLLVTDLESTTDSLQLIADSLQVGIDSFQLALDSIQVDSLLTGADSLAIDSLQAIIDSIQLMVAGLPIDSLTFATDSAQLDLEGVDRSPSTSDTVVIAYQIRNIADESLLWELSEAQAYDDLYRLSSLLPGFSETLVNFIPGSTGILLIPSAEAYGEVGNETIPAGTTLRVDITLLDFF